MMKPYRVFILVFLCLSLIPLKAFAQNEPLMLSGNRLLRIIEAGKVYPVAEFTPRMPLKIQVQGPGRLSVYIKTAIYHTYAKLPAFKLFVKTDNYLTNQYLFPETTRSNTYVEGIKDYSPSLQTNILPIDVPDGVHTYELFLANQPYIIGLASFTYTPYQTGEKKIPIARQEGFYKETSYTKSGIRWFYVKPYGLIGDVYEQGTNNNSIYGGVGIDADIFLQRHFAISGIVNYTDAEQRYLVWRNLPLPLGAGMYIVNEQTLLVEGIASYAIVHNNDNIAMIGAGWGNLQLINSSFPGEVDGPLVSVFFDIELSSLVHFSFRPSYMQDISNTSASTNSILGTPYSLVLYPAGISFRLSRNASIEIGYDGRLLTFKNTNRFYNGGFVAAVF